MPPHNSAIADLDLLRHELRTPLTGMLGLAEMISTLDLPTRAHFWLATLQACGQQMASLIDWALRSGGPGSPLDQQVAVDGLKLMEFLIAAHWPAARAGQTRLILVFHPEALGPWQLDITALRQAVDNLLANAIRFSRNGCVLLEIRAVEQGVTGPDQLEFVIEDSGPDPESMASRLQDEGEYSDRTYPMYSRGRGLQVTELACQRFAGSLQRSSSSFGGARFTLAVSGRFPGLRQQMRPFRPVLLKKLRCVLRLEVIQQRALIAMLRCLNIDIEVDNCELPTELAAQPAFQVLICTRALWPQSYPKCSGNLSANSISLLVKIAGTTGPELYQQHLPEPLFQADLQNALLRCLVVQGMAACRQQEIQQ